MTADSLFGSYYNCPQAGYTAAVAIPNCSIYNNYNKSYDRQIAGFGEATIGLVDNLSLVVGARVSKLGFSLNDISNGYEITAPTPRRARHRTLRSRPASGSIGR